MSVSGANVVRVSAQSSGLHISFRSLSRRMSERGTMQWDEAAVQTSFDIGNLRCFSPYGEKSYYFLPKQPDLARDSAGRPMLTFIDADTTGYLLLSARWAASASNLEALRHELARRTREPAPASITLSFAPVRSPRCQVLIGDGSGAFHPLTTSNTSGVPPYDAVFNVVLQHEQLSQAKAGLRGESGFLAVEYLADLQSPVTGKGTFHARAEDLLPWLRSHATEEDMPSLVEQAVQRDLATVRVEVSHEHASRLTGELYEQVLARAARMLPRWMDQSGTGDIQISSTVEQTLSEPVRAFADVGAIVSEESVQSVSGGRNAAN